MYSIKKAMETYARQGGSSSVFVHDDGLQLIDEADRQERIRFYGDNDIGWVARPKHDSYNFEGGFKRRGRFKRASNMNYGLALSLKMEEHIRRLELERGEKDSATDSVVSDDASEGIEEQALCLAIEETFEESGRQHRPWAHNARSLRIGEIILLVDSDVIIPEVKLSDFSIGFGIDSLRRIASVTLHASLASALKSQSFNMSQVSPLFFLYFIFFSDSHTVDVMQVAHHSFENGITYFTRRTNKFISMACANGEVVPFVGHNAFLRWSALQDAMFEDAGDNNKRKIWSEANTLEDFEMTLRLMVCVSELVKLHILMAVHS